MIEVTYPNGSMHTFDTISDAEEGIRNIFDESGMIPDYVEDPDGIKEYSCTWSVKVQEE